MNIVLQIYVAAWLVGIVLLGSGCCVIANKYRHNCTRNPRETRAFISIHATLELAWISYLIIHF